MAWPVDRDTSATCGSRSRTITGFLARDHAPASSFMEIYDSRQFHPLNDLFHGIAAGPDTLMATRSTCDSGLTRTLSGGSS